MSNTPNYSFQQEAKICAIDAIDRELKRIEDLIHAQNSSAGCDCDGQVSLTDFERLLADITSCKEALGGKVDKQEGHSLISQECLQQICQNEEGLALLEQSLQRLQEWLDWVQDELAGKATKRAPIRHALALAEPFKRVNAAEYWKTDDEMVLVTFRVETADGSTLQRGLYTVAQMPEGFYPTGYVAHSTGNAHVNESEFAGQISIFTTEDGKIMMRSYYDASTFMGTLAFFAD